MILLPNGPCELPRGMSIYLQSAELLGLIAGNFRIDELGQEEFSQSGVLKTKRRCTGLFKHRTVRMSGRTDRRVADETAIEVILQSDAF